MSAMPGWRVRQLVMRGRSCGARLVPASNCRVGDAMNARSGDVYYLATGSAGEKRLALLDEVYGPDAARIMLGIGIPRGGRIADLGCGTGNTLRWFADQVGEAGEVTGIDLSAEQLAIA